MSKLAALVMLFAGCESGFGGTDGDRGYAVSPSEIEFVHELGVTACPQDLGDVVVTNMTDQAFVFTASVTDTEGTDVIDFGDAAGPTSTGSIELEADVGGSVAFVLWFNCQHQILVDSTIRIEPADLGLPFTTFGVTGTIR